MTPSTPPPPADPPPAIAPQAFRRLAHTAVDMIADHLEGMRSRPVFQPMSTVERATHLERSLPRRGAEAESLLALIEREVLAHPMGNGHPRFFGWVNSPPAPIGIIADLVAAALNPSCAGGDHAVTSGCGRNNRLVGSDRPRRATDRVYSSSSGSASFSFR